MVGSVEQIERDLAALQQTLATTAEEFHSIYTGYLTALGQATYQQLILASYHLCTQGYPEKFLKLSFSDRQKLQQSLRQLAKQAQAQLLELLHPIGSEPPTPEPIPVIDGLAELESLLNAGLDLDSSSDSEPTPAAIEPEVTTDSTPELEPAPDESEEGLQPNTIVRWQGRLERSLASKLRTISHDANQLFQQAGILTKELPEVVLEAAIKSEQAGEAIASTPHLLNLLVETVTDNSESGERLRPAAVTHIVAIHLRLSEIEFTDGTVSVWRHKIRNLSARLHTLGRQYAQKQRERAIAEAEAAWRSSWFED